MYSFAMKPTISILIITYNRVDDTIALLESIKQQINLNQHVGEILLLNNASTTSYKEIEDFVQSNPQMLIEYIPHKENLGVARGRNFLIEKARFPYLFVLDDDVVFARNTAIEQVSRLWEKPHFKDNNTAVITLNIYYVNNIF